MDTKILNDIIKNNNLTCTPLQFTNFLKGVVVNTSMYDKLMPTKCLFSKKYKGQIINNPAKGKYYYYITIGGMTFLQNSVPYVQGLVGLDDTNIDKVILDHKTKLIAGFVDSEKIRLTIANFKPKI